MLFCRAAAAGMLPVSSHGCCCSLQVPSGVMGFGLGTLSWAERPSLLAGLLVRPQETRARRCAANSSGDQETVQTSRSGSPERIADWRF